MENLVVFDCEVYPNLFLICFKGLESQKVITISIKDKEVLSDIDIATIKSIFMNKMCFGFNTRNYDIPIILYALKKMNPYQIFNLSKNIIEKSQYGWQTLQSQNLKIPESWKWFDIQEVAGARSSLKLYGARLHSNKIIELPYDPTIELNQEQINNVITYCVNDLDLTINLYERLKDQIELRAKMSIEYKENLLSKSDAQIAEKIIKSKLNISNVNIKQPESFKYIKPNFIKFKSDYLNNLLKLILDIDFILDDKGSIQLPKELEKETIVINNKKYNLGIGGLHSCEKSITYYSNDKFTIIDKDVASYYPSIILNCNLYPKQLGEKFLKVYKDIVMRRLLAKKTKDKVTNESLKIVINGSFGKLGSKYSILYSPNLMIQVTITGQLCLLMLIEKLEENGIEVISANTDGIVSYITNDKVKLFEKICLDWELNTGFELEGTKYKAYHSRDVNNYLAIKFDNTTKGKGIFTKDTLSKNPQGTIIFDSVIEYLVNNKPIMKTLKECIDIKKFITVRTVTGGAKWNEEYLGKVVRWIYSTQGNTIHYCKNNNKVAKSDGAYPIKELCDLPIHIDYSKYEEEALEIIKLLGLKL